jgi:hypothetical protein
MKSTRKTVYNHRIAQNKSKEDWETKFVSKLDEDGEDVANNLLYLAATKLFQAGKSDYNKYYTEENKSSLIKKINEIANHPYNVKIHPKFKENIQTAIDKLNEKIKAQPSSSSGSGAGSGDSSKLDPERDGVASNIEFGSSSSNTIPGTPTPSVMPELATDRKPEPGKTYFKPDYLEAFSDLRLVLMYPKKYPASKPKEIKDFIQKEFLNKYPGDEYIAGFKDSRGRPYSRVREFNILIQEYNNKNTPKLDELVVLPLRR